MTYQERNPPWGTDWVAVRAKSGRYRFGEALLGSPLKHGVCWLRQWGSWKPWQSVGIHGPRGIASRSKSASFKHHVGDEWLMIKSSVCSRRQLLRSQGRPRRLAFGRIA
jgi:hypothetical protein